MKMRKVSIIIILILAVFFIYSPYIKSEQKINSSEFHEAIYYRKLPDGRVQCLLDPFECVLAEGQRGRCRTRINKGGKLYSMVYGKAAAVHIDPIEKKPLFHVLPSAKAFSIATAGCNMGCLFCQNWQLSQARPEDVTAYNLSPQQIVDSAIKSNCETIAYTYSEPIIFYEYMLDTAKIARQKGIKNLMVTAGFINPQPLRELCKYIDAAHVDLKGFSKEYYRDVVFGDLDIVLQTLKIMKEEGVWVEIVNLVVPTLNDDPEMIRNMCVWIRENLGKDVPLHFSRFQPQYKLKNLPPTPVKTLEQARSIAQSEGLKFVYIGNVAGHEGENTYCPSCFRLLIKRVGYEIIEYNIVNARCKFCDQEIPGIWKK